jgi:hypothetical protein
MMVSFSPISQGMHEDLLLLKDLNSLVFVPFTGPKYAKRNYGLDWFAEPDLKRFESPTALLNDTGINGGAAVIQQLFSRDPVYHDSFKQCTVFSTYTLPRIRSKAVDHEFWRNTRRTEYWEKDVWIFPIHQPRQLHWVLAVAYVRSGEVYLFDSFADRNQWKKDIPVRFCCLRHCLDFII